jgi:hypothetical protein
MRLLGGFGCRYMLVSGVPGPKPIAVALMLSDKVASEKNMGTFIPDDFEHEVATISCLRVRGSCC